MMNQKHLNEIKAREQATTQGAWDVSETPQCTKIICGNERHFLIIARDLDSSDAAFIAKARTDIPELIDEVERQREIIDGYAASARAIALYLKDFCDSTLPYNEMIADAARKSARYIANNTVKAQQITALTERLRKANEELTSHLK